MKKVLLILAMWVALSMCQDDTVTAEDMQKWIRARGTFLASVVNMTAKLDYGAEKLKTQVRQEAVDALKYLLQIDFGSKYVLKLNDTEYNYYMNQEVELPVLCNPNEFQNANTKDKQGNDLKSGFLDWDAITSIVAGAKDMIQCWLKEVDKQLPTGQYEFYDTTTLPFLTPIQVGGFYKCAARKDSIAGRIPNNYISPDDAFVDPVALIQVLTWGDQGRTDFGWLELWVYMCSLGRQPKVHKYIEKDPDALKKYMQNSIKLRQKQAIARNMMDANEAIEKLQKDIQDIASGKKAATKFVNADGTVTDKPKLMRLKKRHHKKHHKKSHKKEPKYTEEQKKKLIPLLKEWDKWETFRQGIIMQIRGDMPVQVDPLPPIDRKRILRKARIFEKGQSKRDKVEAVIDKVHIDKKEVEKYAKGMSISHSSMEAAKVLRMAYEKATSKKVTKLLRRRKMRRMRKDSRKQ